MDLTPETKWRSLPPFIHGDFVESSAKALTFASIMTTVGRYQRICHLVRLGQRSDAPSSLHIKRPDTLGLTSYRYRTTLSFAVAAPNSLCIAALIAEGLLFGVAHDHITHVLHWYVAPITESTAWPDFKPIASNDITYYHPLEVDIEIERHGTALCFRLKTGPTTKGQGLLSGAYGWSTAYEITVDNIAMAFGLCAFGALPPRASRSEEYRFDTDVPYVEFQDLVLAVPAQ